MLVWCDLHVARNVLCTAISRAVVINTRDFTKTLGTSHKTHACTALASVKFKSSCTVRIYRSNDWSMWAVPAPPQWVFFLVILKLLPTRFTCFIVLPNLAALCDIAKIRTSLQLTNQFLQSCNPTQVVTHLPSTEQTQAATQSSGYVYL